jgi:hypothetical protein
MTGSKRALAVLAAGALCAPLVSLSSPAFAAGEATPPAPLDISDLCANVDESENPFVDIEGNTFEQNIICLAFAEITLGTNPEGDRYSPGQEVNRGQMASFIARLIDTADELDTGDNIQGLEASDGVVAFTDVAANNTHRENIDRLDQAGIVQGGPGGRPATIYGPNLPVTRAQMASFIKRALEYMTSDNFDTAEDFFTDDEGKWYEDSVNRVAAAGLMDGCGGTSFCPGQYVRRQELADIFYRRLAN